MDTPARLLIFSHDSFGLGHLRRCRAIAHHLVEQFPQLSVLILSGSPIIGSFDFRTRVDFVRVPGVIKLRNGDYTSLSLHIDITQTIALRSSIVRHTAEIFDPDVFIVDKEPLGLRGEVRETLEFLHARGTTLVLGLRDVMDDPSQLAPEWERKKAVSALRQFYDEIWVYGLPQICEPLSGLGAPASVQRKMVYSGYLRRRLPELRVIMEHVTTKDGVDYVASQPANLGATITTHHLIINRNAILAGGIRPHYYCLPVAKREIHRQALRRAATSGDGRFFLGTDSAPHVDAAKQTACGCAGIFTAPNTLPCLAHVFEDEGALDRLEAFVSFNGANFYGLPRNRTTIVLEREETPVSFADRIETGEGPVTVFDPMFPIHWNVARAAGTAAPSLIARGTA